MIAVTDLSQYPVDPAQVRGRNLTDNSLCLDIYDADSNVTQFDLFLLVNGQWQYQGEVGINSHDPSCPQGQTTYKAAEIPGANQAWDVIAIDPNLGQSDTAFVGADGFPSSY